MCVTLAEASFIEFCKYPNIYDALPKANTVLVLICGLTSLSINNNLIMHVCVIVEESSSASLTIVNAFAVHVEGSCDVDVALSEC